MRRIILSLFMSMFLLGTAYSQFTLLVEGGANYGKASALKTNLFDHDNITSYYLGASPKFALLNNLKAVAEFQYSREGADISSDFSEDIKVRQHYIRFIPGVDVKIIGPVSVIGGLNIGYAAAETVRIGNTLTTSNDRVNQFEKSDYGVLLGLNANFSGLNLAIKYNYGFKDLNDTSFTDIDGNALADFSVKSRFLQVGLGYEFGL